MLMFLDRCRSWWKRRSWRPRWHLRSPRPPRRPSARPRRRRCRRRCRSRCYGRPPWWCDRHRRTMRQLRQAIHDAMIHEISMKCEWFSNFWKIWKFLSEMCDFMRFLKRDRLDNETISNRYSNINYKKRGIPRIRWAKATKTTCQP